MIDVHCHLNFQAFENDYDEVIKRAFDAGVTTIINVGTKLDTSKKAVELASKYEHLYAIVGIHPHHADKVELGTDWLKELEEISLSSKKVLAIGEIGLDNYRYQSNGTAAAALPARCINSRDGVPAAIVAASSAAASAALVTSTVMCGIVPQRLARGPEQTSYAGLAQPQG